MPTYSASNKVIAKNTLMLYVRMFLTMIVGLYTSRVVLATLGVDDFGIYNVVGGIVSLMAFVNSAMSGASSRFIAYELGRGDFEKLQQTFSSALVVHLGIALFVLIVAETLGIWFVENKIDIPADRMVAARFVYQGSVISSVIGIINVPFNASIIAHERMNFYAYIEILHAVLKLAIVFLIQWIAFDKLISYSCLLVVVSLIIFLCYNLYTRHFFEECRHIKYYDGSIIKSILSFSGFNLFGNFGSVFNRQGINILINNFFGLALNAASGLATTVANMVSSFSNSIITAFRPPITKSYSSGNYSDVEKYSILAFILTIFLFSLIAVPAAIELEKVLAIWLVEVPQYTVIFTRLILGCLFFEIIRYVATITIHATGKVKLMSLFNGCLLTLNPFVIFILFKCFKQSYLAYVSYVVVNFLLAGISIVLMKRYARQLSLRRIMTNIIKAIGCSALSFLCALPVSYLLAPSFGRIVLTTVVSSIIMVTSYYCICLTHDQRDWLQTYLKTKFSK